MAKFSLTMSSTEFDSTNYFFATDADYGEKNNDNTGPGCRGGTGVSEQITRHSSLMATGFLLAPSTRCY